MSSATAEGVPCNEVVVIGFRSGATVRIQVVSAAVFIKTLAKARADLAESMQAYQSAWYIENQVALDVARIEYVMPGITLL